MKPSFGIDLNSEIKNFVCPHCGEQSVKVWGSVSKNGAAYAVYFVYLMTGHEETSARFTISFGGWGGQTHEERRWVYIEARPTSDSYEMMVREPEESLFYETAILGLPLGRAEVLSSSQKDAIFELADYIAFNDPAVKSYLCGEEVSKDGRAERIH